MSKYFRKNPKIVEAFKLGFECMPDWFIEAIKYDKVNLYNLSTFTKYYGGLNANITTSHKIIHANYGDYIILKDSNELCALDAKSFEKIYQRL